MYQIEMLIIKSFVKTPEINKDTFGRNDTNFMQLKL